MPQESEMASPLCVMAAMSSQVTGSSAQIKQEAVFSFRSSYIIDTYFGTFEVFLFCEAGEVWCVRLHSLISNV